MNECGAYLSDLTNFRLQQMLDTHFYITSFLHSKAPQIAHLQKSASVDERIAQYPGVGCFENGLFYYASDYSREICRANQKSVYAFENSTLYKMQQRNTNNACPCILLCASAVATIDTLLVKFVVLHGKFAVSPRQRYDLFIL